ncbi:hypothetical protein F511_04395 [Dorcoceras hygrometricum]|uniref:Uncharacterized protein n=1 Tax=Dorcoceras hygrometricum TaxID=472368 RepID=A0A2Z7BSA3_9LAMI|nr:hypothetical protein F511_04395 [Dorcoceras hygrometricum]
MDAGVRESIQEPSSPKVTCIGQVRVRRSAVSKAEKPVMAAASRHTCWWVKKALFGEKNLTISCCRKRSFRRVFCKWGFFFRSGYCKKVDATEDSSFRAYSDQKSENYEYFGAGVQEFKRDFLESPSSPPKNALILTRCRSAPYRSSSLAGRFWSSPLSENGDQNEAKSEEPKEPRYENSPESVKGSENSASIEQEPEEIAGNSLHPLLLTRCKSGPARTGTRLDPEATLWSQRKLGA